MERLTPIPSPPGHLVREFFHRAVPILAFCASAITVASLWNTRFSGTFLTGEVEPIRADVTTLLGGSIADLAVERFQQVTNGQPIAIVETMETDAAQRALDGLRAELELVRSRTALSEARNEQSVEDVRIHWLDARVNLATARVKLETATRELQRSAQLLAEKIIADAEYDLAKKVHDALDAEVRERSGLLEGLQATLSRLEAAEKHDKSKSMEAFNAALAAEERKIEEGRLVVLKAPLDGIVKSINHRRGERVTAGSVLATVTAHRSEHIVGFVRQPLVLDPRPGMAVEIRTRGLRRQVAASSIRSVGSDLEFVGSSLRLKGQNPAVERGVAFFVDVPAGLDVHPGEVVDLIVRPRSNKAAN